MDRHQSSPSQPAVRSPVTVVTVDDQEIFRRAARSLIEAAPGFVQIGEAASGAEALALVAELQPDLVLLDMRMPGVDGLETARRIALAESPAIVVLISLADEPLQPTAMASAGAAAYLRKQDLSVTTLDATWARVRAADQARSAR
ncbi:MAG TPA: response regulator transcription factor [Conexibacter sp.]|nr:response regulator transcription factor [Conexibacter sp.]